MVSNITPNTSGASALGVDHRYMRGQSPTQTQARTDNARGDRVEIGDAAAWAAARESVRTGLNQVHQALAIGADAQSMLLQVMQIAREGGDQSQLDSVLSAYAERVDAAINGGAKLAAGGAFSVQAEPGADPVEVAGADLRLKDAPAPGQVLQISASANVADADLIKAAQASLDALQEAMQGLLDAARSLEAHQGFLGAAAGVTSGITDLDADSARLLALQIRQGLDAVGGGASIANAEPQAVLSLFRA
ncbi:MAG: hypothetical protein NW206_04700 [Hyphomonadaceae bacterium]|nr:hypothetical protein [Hyphomonadaceae bacterium]